MDPLATALQAATDATLAYRASLAERPVAARTGVDELVLALGGPLPNEPTPAAEVVDQLVRHGEAGLVATTGPRYFGFVIGGALPAATAADVLATGWDVVAFNAVTSPLAVAAE